MSWDNKWVRHSPNLHPCTMPLSLTALLNYHTGIFDGEIHYRSTERVRNPSCERTCELLISLSYRSELGSDLWQSYLLNQCISITRTVNKIGRRTVPPAKLFAACGFGPDDSNWKHICKIRKEGRGRAGKLSASQEWLLNGDSSDGMECYEEQRKRNFEIVRSALDGCSVKGVDLLKTL